MGSLQPALPSFSCLAMGSSMAMFSISWPQCPCYPPPLLHLTALGLGPKKKSVSLIGPEHTHTRQLLCPSKMFLCLLGTLPFPSSYWRRGRDNRPTQNQVCLSTYPGGAEHISLCHHLCSYPLR
jgi:hypothetical protein